MKGLYRKYKIEKADGSPIDENAAYFILRYDKDIFAMIALKAYADAVRFANPQLANDIYDELNAVDVKLTQIPKFG